jgi:protein Tex
VRVRVMEVDVPRKRISLTMRKDGGGEARPQNERMPHGRTSGPKTASPPPHGKGKSSEMGGLGAALAEAMRRK